MVHELIKYTWIPLLSGIILLIIYELGQGKEILEKSEFIFGTIFAGWLAWLIVIENSRIQNEQQSFEIRKKDYDIFLKKLEIISKWQKEYYYANDVFREIGTDSEENIRTKWKNSREAEIHKIYNSHDLESKANETFQIYFSERQEIGYQTNNSFRNCYEYLYKEGKEKEYGIVFHKGIFERHLGIMIKLISARIEYEKDKLQQKQLPYRDYIKNEGIENEPDEIYPNRKTWKSELKERTKNM